MQKFNFHKTRELDLNREKKLKNQKQNLDPKIVVDINKLLNRVKIEERNETKKKITFFSLILLSLSLIGTIIVAIK